MNRFFYDLDGSPLTGKTPVQVHVYGDGDHDTALNEAEGEIAVFLDAVRLSPATQHRREATLESGGSVRMYAVGDEVSAAIFTERRKTSGEPYYGGILVKLNVVPDEAKFRRDCMEDAPPGATLIRHDIKEVIAHAKSSGASPTKPGRPAVPGTEDEDEAEWLILQIAPDKRLDDDPFNKEAIKIFRIAAPQFGPLTEYGQAAEFPVPANAEEEKYIMSAEVSRSSDSNLALTKFFMCGQQIEDIPPLGVAPFSAVTVTSAGWAQTISLRAVDFVPESFEKAYAAGGIVIVAMPHGLFALNTAEKTDLAPATWKTLSEMQMGTAGFGAEFTDETNALGVRTITCFGTSGAGACNSYTVRIAPEPSGPPTITGTMTPNDLPYSPGTPAIMTYTKTMSGVLEDKVDGLAPPLGTQATYQYQRVLHTMGCTSVYRAASPPYEYDWYTGELKPREEPETLTFLTSATHRADQAFPPSFGSTMTSESNSMFFESDWSTGFEITDFTPPMVPNFETLLQDKRRRRLGPMFSARWRAGSWADSSPSVPTWGGEADVLFSGVGSWHWTALNTNYRIEGRDGITLYDWGDIQSKFPTIDNSLWGALSLSTTIGPGSPPGIPAGGGSLPYEPLTSSRPAEGALFWIDPPENNHSAARAYHGGYPTMGRNDTGSWTEPPIPYYVPGDATSPWLNRQEPVNWGLTVNYDPAATGGVFLATAIAGTYPGSGYRDGVFQKAWALTQDAAAQAALPFAHPLAETVYVGLGAVQAPYQGGMWGASSGGHPNAWMGPEPVSDWYIRDPRTGGFIAQMYWSAEITEDPVAWAWPLNGYSVPLKHPVSCEIIVGNDLGTVPLAALLNEWMELGEKAGSFGSLPLSYDLVFIDDRGTAATMLI